MKSLLFKIIFFLDSNPENEWKLAKLDDIDDRISGKSNLYIKKKYPDLFSKVQNTVLPITVLRCDYSKRNHMNYLFTIFHRLNSGGSKLTNQEIRNCIFNGSFNSFLKISVNYPNFISLFEIDPDKIYRFSNEEFILRFISFYSNHENYNGSLSKFLNDFMETNKKAEESIIENYRDIFNRTTDLVYERIMNNSHLPRLSKATTEALFVGVAKNIEVLEIETNAELNVRFASLRNDELFSIDSLKEGLAQKERVVNRLNKAILIFG